MAVRVAGGTDDVRQELLGAAVAVQDVVFAALFKVEYELQGNARPARPARVGRTSGVARHVAGIVFSKVPYGPLVR